MIELHFVRLGAAALLGLAAAACSPSYDHLDFSPQTSPPVAIVLGPTGVEMPIGIAVAVAPVAMAGTQPMKDSVVTLASTNTGILGLAPVPDQGDGQDGQPNSFVMFAVTEGSAGVVVTVDGEEKQTIPARVIAQQ